MPASDRRVRRPLLTALVWGHRWLGIATCLLFAAWFASGAVMLFQPFPALPHGAQVALAAPIGAVTLGPGRAVAAVPGAAAVRLVQRAGRPAYIVEAGGVLNAIDARTGAELPPLSPSQARAEAQRLFGPAATVTGPFAHDQWVVHNRFDPARPFYRLDAGDAAGTQLYLSARSGELLQRTTARARAWNWPGAVLHWAYVTPLRKHWAWWDGTVWWVSLVCLLVAIAGAVLGIVRWRAARRLDPPRFSFFRQPWLRWHHLLGLASGVFVLAWILSGWLSMDHGRLFSRGMATTAEADRYAGCGMAEALRQVDLAALAGADLREVGFTALACRPIVTRYAASGRIDRYAASGRIDRCDGAGRPIDDAAMAARIRSAVALGWPQMGDVRIARVDPTETYAMAEGWPRATWRLRPEAPGRPDLYVDADTGRLLTVMDGSRAAYAWVYYALHTGNVPGLTTHPTLRRALLLVPLAAGFLFSVTGVVIGWQRLRRASRRAGSRS